MRRLLLGMSILAGLAFAIPGVQATTYYNLTGLQADGTTATGYDTVTVNNGLFTSNCCNMGKCRVTRARRSMGGSAPAVGRVETKHNCN